MSAAFAPLCQDEKAHPDTTPQKPRLVSQVRLLQRAADKHCSYLVSKCYTPLKIMVIKGSIPDPQSLPASRHKLPAPTAKSRHYAMAKVLSVVAQAGHSRL